MALQDITPQLRTRLRRVEWMVVLFLGGALLLVLGSIAWWVKQTGDRRGWFILEVPYYTYLETGAGIKVGMPVKMLGFTIGQVAEVDMERDDTYNRAHHYNVFVRMLIREPYYGYIYTDSQIKLGGAGIDLLGGSFLEISREEGGGIPTVVFTNGVPMMLWDQFAHKIQDLDGGGWDDLSQKWANAATDAKAADITNRFVQYRPFTRASSGYYLATRRTDSLVDSATAITETLRNALPGLTNQLGSTLGELNRLVAELREAAGRPGGFGELALPTNLNQRLDQTLADVHDLSRRLDPVLDKTGQTLDTLQDNSRRIGPLMDNVRGVVTNVEKMVIGLQAQLNNTNMVENVSRLAEKAAVLADKATTLTETTTTLLHRHWLFRSAFRTNQSESVRPPPPRATNAPPNRSKL